MFATIITVNWFLIDFFFFFFFCQDIIDLRGNHWLSKDADKGPKTIHEIRESVRIPTFIERDIAHALT